MSMTSFYRPRNSVRMNPFGGGYGPSRPNPLALQRRARQRNARSYTVTRRRKTGTRGIGVTSQHDARLIYRKRRMPKFKKRRWKSFINKVKAVSEKDLGTQQVVFNVPVAFSNTTSGNQCLAQAGLYTLNSSTVSYMNDLRQIASYISQAATTPATGLTVDPSSKILFQSAILDITIRNAATNNGAADSAARMEVDVYEVSMSHTAEESGATYTNLSQVLRLNQTETLPIGGGATSEITIDTRGCSPFELSYVLSRFGVKIWSKRKYTISNGDQITYQVRDPRRYSIPFKELSNQDGFNKPRMSRFVIIVGKLSPGLTVGNTGLPNVYQEILQVGITRKYSFKVENWTEDRTAYLVA